LIFLRYEPKSNAISGGVLEAEERINALYHPYSIIKKHGIQDMLG